MVCRDDRAGCQAKDSDGVGWFGETKMPTVRCVIQYTLCAVSSYGLAATAQATLSPSHSKLSGTVASPDQSSANAPTSASFPLSAEMVAQAVGEIQSAGVDLEVPPSSGHCGGGPGSYYCSVHATTYGPPPSPPPPPPPGGGGGTSPPPPGKSGPLCFVPLAPENRADSAQVFADEGGVRTQGYQPSLSSGVTIGAGVDLSQTQTSELKAYGVPQAIITYLTPWMVPASEVPTTVNRIGWPVLSTANAQILSEDVFNGIYNQVEGYFNEQTTKGFAFNTFPAGVQTAIVDAAYPNGPHLWEAKSVYARAVWADALVGNWNAAENEFNSWQPYNHRYVLDETDILNDIDSSLIPYNDTQGKFSG